MNATDEQFHASHWAWRTWTTTQDVLYALKRIGVVRVWHVAAPCKNGCLCIHHVVWRWTR